MALTKSDLLRRLREAVSQEEWEGLAADGLFVSGFNRNVLLEMQTAEIPEGDLQEQKVIKLHMILKDFLQDHMKENPEGWKWVILSCIYLTFLAKRPMHPVEMMDIKVSEINGKTVYECPQKANGQNTACYYCVCQRMSNYENMKRQMQKEFVKYDQDKMIEKFQLPSDAEYLYIKFLGHTYRIDRSGGEVSWSDDNFMHVNEADYNEAMTIYDVLCYSKEHCKSSGEFVNMQSLSSIQGGSLPVGSGLFQEIEKIFDHEDERLARACECLEGTNMEQGDVADQFPMFDFLPMVIRFWNSDEDFPASLQLFADKHILDYMHYETVWFAVSHLLSRLKEEMEKNKVT